MELKIYWNILWRRIWIIALIVGVVAIYAGYQYYKGQKAAHTVNMSYTSSVLLRVGIQANETSTDQNYADYVSTNEALADEFATGPVLTSSDFATEVSQQIQDDMATITQRYKNGSLGDWHNVQSISKALSAIHTHGLVTVTVNWNTEAGAWAIAQAVGEVSVNHITDYLDYEIRDSASNASDATKHPLAAAKIVSDASDPIGTATTPVSSKTTTLLLLLLIALIIGIALAFLIEYLDDRIWRTEDAVQMLQLPVYGEVPHAPAVGQSRIKNSAVV